MTFTFHDEAYVDRCTHDRHVMTFESSVLQEANLVHGHGVILVLPHDLHKEPRWPP